MAYVDDITIEVTSTLRDTAKLLTQAGVHLCGELEGGCKMAISTTKSAVVASVARIGHEVAHALRQYGVAHRRVLKSLGVGIAAGVRRTTRVMQVRLHALRARAQRIRRLRRSRVNATRLFSTGGAAVAEYGLPVTGISDSSLLVRRRIVAAAVGSSTSGRNLDLDLLLAEGSDRCRRVDPAFEATAAPLATWAEAVWMKWAPRTAMARAVAYAKERMAAAKRPWACATGPAAVAVATAARIGWFFEDALVLVTDEGRRLDLLMDPPCEVRREACRAVERWWWRRIALDLPALQGPHGVGAVIGPIRRLLTAAARDENWTRQCQGGLRSAIIDSQWPQARLAKAGLAAESRCQRCPTLEVASSSSGGQQLHTDGMQHDTAHLEPYLAAHPVSHLAPPAANNLPTDDGERLRDDDGRGTALHRCVGCRPNLDEAKRRFHAVLDELRAASRRAVLEVEAGIAGGASQAAAVTKWTRGLIASVDRLVPPPPPEATFRWEVHPPAGGIPVAVVYTDGSMVDGPSRLTARLGWSFVAVDAQGRIVVSASGVPPPWVRGIAGAEAWALLQAVREAAPGSVFKTDSLSCQQTLVRGRAFATAPSRPLARIWSQVLHVLDSEEAAQSVVWMPAHTAAHDVGCRALSDASTLSEVDRWANERADALAKKAAMATRVPLAVRKALLRTEADARQAAVHVGRATWVANSFPEAPHRDSAPPVRRRREDGSLARAAPRRGRVAPAVTARPPGLGGHTMHGSAAGGWACSVCRRSAARWRDIAPERCPGSAALAWARRACALLQNGGTDGAGHVRFLSDAVVWCDRCGSYAESWAVGLARRCPGGPRNDGKAQHLRRLRAGRHPETGQPFRAGPFPEPTPGACQAPTALAVATEPWGSVGGSTGRRRAASNRPKKLPGGGGPPRRRCAATAAPRSRVVGSRGGFATPTAAAATTATRGSAHLGADELTGAADDAPRAPSAAAVAMHAVHRRVARRLAAPPPDNPSTCCGGPLSVVAASDGGVDGGPAPSPRCRPRPLDYDDDGCDLLDGLTPPRKVQRLLLSAGSSCGALPPPPTASPSSCSSLTHEATGVEPPCKRRRGPALALTSISATGSGAAALAGTGQPPAAPRAARAREGGPEPFAVASKRARRALLALLDPGAG